MLSVEHNEGPDTALAGQWARRSPVDVAPGAMQPVAVQRIQPLIELLGAVRRRSWLLVTADRTAVSVAIWAAVFGVVALLIRGAFVADDGNWMFAVAAVAVVSGAWIVAHRHRWFSAAMLVDERGQGMDRVATAFELAAVGREDAWAEIQAAEAVAWGQNVDVKAIVPVRRPRHVGWALGGAAIALIGILVPVAWLLAERDPGTHDAVDVGLPVAVPHLRSAAELLGEDDLELIAADVELLQDIEAQLDDGATKAWLGKVRKVLDDVVNARIDKRDAMEKLAELQRQKPSKSDPREPGGANSRSPNAGKDPKKAAQQRKSAAEREQRQASEDKAVRNSISRAMKESLADAPKGKEREELRKASENKSLDGIAKMVEKLANKNWTDKELDKWIKVAEKFAKKLGDRKIPKRFDELKKRIQRLTQKRRRQGGLSSADRRRLRSARRNHQQLRRKHGDMEAAKYRLQRLQRQTKKAMNELRRQRNKRRLGRRGNRKKAQDEARRQHKQRQQKFRKSMRRASQQMRRMSQQQKQRQAQRIGQSRMRQLRESMGRAGRRSASRRDFERRARQRRKQAGKSGQGKKKAGQGRRDRMRQAKAAGRKASEKRAQARGSSGSSAQRKKKRHYSYKLGDSDMPENPRMRMMRQAGGPPKGGGEGVGIDDGNDPKGPGKSKRIGVGRTEKVRGIDNEGPTVKQVFLDAAKKGFARQSWRSVYADYSEVAESMIAKEGLPVGRRALVRRYFELIRPRAAPAKAP